MLKWFFLFIFLPILMFASDAKFENNFLKRHRDMISYFTEKPPLPWSQQPVMLGSWGGFREMLAKKGITMSAAVVTDALGNPVGGKSRGFAQATSFGADVFADLDTLVHIPGLIFYNSWVFRFGTSLTLKKIKNQFSVQQVFGNETIMLNTLLLRWQSSQDEVHIKVGRLDAGNDFLQSDYYYNFVSNAFCGNPVAVFYNLPFSAYPVAVWGAYTHFRPYKRIIVKFAAFDGNKARIQGDHFHGMNFTFKSNQGVLLTTEASFLVNQEPDDCGYPGNYKMGYFHLTGSVTPFGSAIKRDSLFYFMFDQMIYRRGDPGSDQGLVPFAGFLFFPEKKNLMPFFFLAGLCYKGLFPSRPQDVTSIGVAGGRYSRELQNLERDQHLEEQHTETVIEFNHNFQVTPWFFFQPDLQYIITPKGLSSIPNALVLGFQTGLSF